MLMSMVAPALQDTIAAENERFMRAFKQADAAGVAALYSEDGQLLPPGAPAASGWDAIRLFWQAAMDSGIHAAQLETVELEDHGETVIELGRYTLCGAAEQSLDQGKYMVIWKREHGVWKLYRDIFNSNGPMIGV